VLHRYVLSDISGTLVLAFLIVMGLMSLFILLEAGRRAGVGMETLVVIAPTALPFGLKYALPVALLLAVTFTFSRMSSDNEITALRAAGSSLWPVAAPVILVALLLSLLLLGVTMLWLPRAQVAKRDIFRKAGLNVLQNLPPGEQQFQFGRVRLAYGDAGKGRLEDIYLTEAREDGMRLKITAKEGRWSFDSRRNILEFQLKHSQWTWMGENGKQEQKVNPEVVPFRLDLANLYPSRPKRTKDYTLSQILGIRKVIRDYPARLPPIFRWKPRELDYELHGRFAGALSPLIMALLGMPLGVLARARGKLVAFFIGFMPVLAFYYPLTLVGEGLGTEGALNPALAAWGADGIVGVLGLALTWRMMFR
jgi:lipopolysaccharide export system permease protein